MGNYIWAQAADGTTLYEIGVRPDGTLQNPRGYPDDLVRETVAAADQRKHDRRSRAAKKAAKTREDRKRLIVAKIARRSLERQQIGPRRNCAICGKRLGDIQSIQRGIGSECWQGVLEQITKLRAEENIVADLQF